MTTETNLIDWKELLTNCFSSKTLKQVQAVRFHKGGPYMIRLNWDREGLPLGEQIVWLLYHPKSMRPIQRMLEDLIKVARSTEGHHTLIIDDYNPSTHWPYTIMMLSDGGFSLNATTLMMNEDGAEGHIGWIVGQGRHMAEDDTTVSTIHAILSNILPTGKDRFLLHGRKKLDKMKEAMTRAGFPWDEPTIAELRNKETEKE